MADDKVCDVVLEGGGVKGIGLVGAITELQKVRPSFCRVAGTSAGAIVGALAAAGMSAEQLTVTMKSLDYKNFRDKGFIDRFGLADESLSLLFEKGIYEGDYARQWLGRLLEDLGVRTFADLRLTAQWAQKLPPEQRYKLVVIATDISRGRMVRLPWDYHRYGLDADSQLVADAVRASMSIPFFYEPVRLGNSQLVDGGVLSNFPIDIFDNTSGWPTFGIKLSAREGAIRAVNPTNNPVDFVQALVSTAMNAHDQMHLDNPCTLMRTIFVDTFDVRGMDFDISPQTQQRLFASGKQAARKFLDHWDFQAYRQRCESGTS